MKEIIYDINIDNEFLLKKFENSVILDIETTGLSRNYHNIFLIGLIEIKKHSEIRLFFAEHPKEEYQLIRSITKYLNKTVITYNGRTFDIPFIKEKAALYEVNIPEIQGFDLYRYISNYKNILNLPNYKQKTIEEYMGLFRDEFISGGKVVEKYQDYIITKNENDMNQILTHNKDDVKGLLKALEIVEKLENLNTISIGKKHFTIEKIYYHGNILHIEGYTNFDEPYIYNFFNYSLVIEKRKFNMRIDTKKAKYSPDKNCNYILKENYPGVENKEKIKTPDQILILSIEKEILYKNVFELVEKMLINF